MEPTSILESLLSPHWTQVVQEELSTLFANQTWCVVSLPSGRVPIECKWLFFGSKCMQMEI